MKETQEKRLSIGVEGLDEILHGGLLPRRAYMVRGQSGTGKTTLGLHFLTAGAAKGEKALFISLGQPAEEIRRDAERLGFDLSGVTFLDLSPKPELFAKGQVYDIFSPAEVERGPTTQKIVEQVEALKPRRVYIDALTQFRYLTPDVFSFRRQTLSFLSYLTEQGATVGFSSEYSPEAPDDDLQFISNGIIALGRDPQRRSVEVLKYHGSDFRRGPQTMVLTDKGMVVYPRLIPEVHRQKFVHEQIPSGVPEMDELLHGGIGRGTFTLITGPSGSGKTTIGMQFMKEAAGRGESSVVYSFEEDTESIVARCESINIPVRAMMEQGKLSIVPIEPLRFTPDEFANLVRTEVEKRKATVVMVDGVEGYNLSLRGEDLNSHLYSLSRYIRNTGVTGFLTNEVEYVTGEFRATEIGISYMVDNIIFLRYIEMNGELRKAIGVLKKRTGSFEKTLREIEITRYGLKVGKPLTGLRGVLRGVPERTGRAQSEEER